jgi:hypothetical protein
MNKNITCAVLFALFSSAFVSCDNKTASDDYYFQDFDNLKAWNQGSQVTNEFCHSGKYCTYTDTIHRVSQVFEMEIDKEMAKKYKRIQISAWCRKIIANSKVKLIASIETENSGLTNVSEEFADRLELPNFWINLVFFLKFPDQLPDKSRIKIFCFSPDGEKSFMDDVSVEFLKN